MNEQTITVPASVMEANVRTAFRAIGTSEASLDAVTRALMHASLLGVDSHGVRLATHYCRMLEGGRLNKAPALSIDQRGAAAAVLDGDDGLGHYAAYEAMRHACDLADSAGIGAVGVRRSSHFGAAGAYVLAAAERGYVAMATTNADSMVPLFGGAERFHGTNPLAFAAPVADGDPWLFDMATSSIPMNRVLLYRSLGKELPDGVAADAVGATVTDPQAADMVLPLGGETYGYKGAGLAGVATLLSAILTGTTLDPDFIAMVGSDDISTPRNMGHFVLAISPDHFIGRALFDAGMLRYLDRLRGAAARPGTSVMAPGDREWRERDRRQAQGIPIDLDTARFLGFA